MLIAFLVLVDERRADSGVFFNSVFVVTIYRLTTIDRFTLGHNPTGENPKFNTAVTCLLPPLILSTQWISCPW